MDFPNFWNDIAKEIQTDIDGIKHIQIILNHLGYTTLISLLNLSKVNEIKSLEVEILSLQKNSEFVENHTFLKQWVFGSGIRKNLNQIAIAAKHLLRKKDCDVQSVRDKLYASLQKVSSTNFHIIHFTFLLICGMCFVIRSWKILMNLIFYWILKQINAKLYAQK